MGSDEVGAGTSAQTLPRGHRMSGTARDSGVIGEGMWEARPEGRASPYSEAGVDRPSPASAGYSPGTNAIPHPVPVCVVIADPASTIRSSVASYASAIVSRR